MGGIIGLAVLIVLLVVNYSLVSSATKNISNHKLQSLIMSIANFILVMLFVIILPITGGYSYSSFQDMIDVLFDEETATLLTITIIGFIVAISYYAVGTYKLYCINKANRKIEEQKRIEEQKKKDEQQEKEKQRQKEEQQRRDEQRRIAAEKQREQEIIDSENKRIADIKQKISQIRKRYKPDPMKAPVDGIRISVKKEKINKDIVHTVDLLKEKISRLVEECKPIDSEINRILRCNNIELADQKLVYLLSEENKLDDLKRKSDELHTLIQKQKIILIEKNFDVLGELIRCFTLLKNSERLSFKNANTNAILCDKKPHELDLFIYESEPAILYIKQHYYCFFSNFILVFDNEGAFCVALDPTALSISVKRLEENMTVTNNVPSRCKHISSDSKLINKGQTKMTWEHTCLDGSPDLRYHNNLRTQYRIDTYEYGEIEFNLSGVKFSCSISSMKAIDAFEEIISKYIIRNNCLHNPIPEFIGLIKKISDENDEAAEAIINDYKKYESSKNSFCEIANVNAERE